MALFFLEYDLRKQRNYDALYAELAAFNAVRILKSLWCFNRVSTSASGLRDHFKKFIDSDDGLIVSEVTDWAAYNVEGNPNQLN
jgi:alkylhydroperoxidase family enzyme